MDLFSGYIDGLGDAVEQGLVKAVGVSNYSGNLFELLHVLFLIRNQTSSTDTLNYMYMCIILFLLIRKAAP